MKEQECLLLARLDEPDRMIKKSQKETVTKLSQEISLLDSLIFEMEGKCQQPSSDFLQVRHVKLLQPLQRGGEGLNYRYRGINRSGFIN